MMSLSFLDDYKRCLQFAKGLNDRETEHQLYDILCESLCYSFHQGDRAFAGAWVVLMDFLNARRP